jgi:hypothetical protein
MDNKLVFSLLRFGAIVGNIIFIGWVLFNAISAGFRGTLYEKISGFALIGLLSINSFFLIRKTKQDWENV